MGNESSRMVQNEPENELASRILERAQLAQMARQLKVDLGRVGADKEASNAGVRPRPLSAPAGFTSASSRAQKKGLTSYPAPLTGLAGASENIARKRSPEHTTKSSSPLKKVVLESPEGPGLRSTEEIHLGKESTTTHTTLNTGSGSNAPKTPKPSRAEDDNAGAADLLMYLATSPFNSGRSQTSFQTGSRVPFTPSQEPTIANFDSTEPVRFSHMKPSMASPQSTFKVPQHVSTSHMGFQDMLMESPSLYLNSGLNNTNHSNSTPSPRKRRTSSYAPTTPSRDQSSGANHNLLKTPNFNMGDYIHNIFSPSPRVSMHSHDVHEDFQSAIATSNAIFTNSPDKDAKDN